jgi:uncharacterized cupredoxin-like copper-binding protein
MKEVVMSTGKTRTTLAFVAMASAAALVLAACSGSSTSTVAAGPATGSSSSSATGAPLAVTLGDTDASHMFMKLDSSKISAGSVTFTVSNDGAKVHEFVVLSTPTLAKDLTYVKSEDEIDEEATGITSPGEVEDIQPGDSATLTVDLPSGHYALVCNLKGHWRMGMYTDLQVN